MDLGARKAPGRIEENAMRKLIAAGTMVVFALATGAIVAEDKKPPDKITYEAKPGPVAFDHAKHVEKAGKDCKTCHDAIFPQAKAPLNYKASMHKTAEADKKSCGACHVSGGKAFESKGNCQKCHVKPAA
jgi:c(7)-type cytochrome triheme protein